MSGRLLILLAVLTAPTAAQDPRAVEHFEKHVRPLLVGQCLECHGAEGKKIKGGLRMTSRVALLAGGDSGPALVPGAPDKSRLLHAVRYGSDELKMPPRGQLKDSEIAALEKWIKDGAVWPDAAATPSVPTEPGQLFTDEQRSFWAFQPPQEHAPPAVRAGGWVQTPIDAFILSKLEARRLRPAAPADKYTLLRRVTFDLTGLPPTIAEIDAFLADQAPNAFEKVVERLLQSPAYGERWGRHWLDVARYADSNGLDENTAFGNAWRYRDYVIRSFNADKPFDQFVREQIAGDLLHKQPSADELTATGFLVLGPKVLAEPDKQKMQMDIADEQLDTIGKAMLGLTLGCARCHDHKFDPLPQRDYYSLLAIFTSTRTMKNLATVAQAYERPLPTGEKPEVVAERARRLELKEAHIKRLTDDLRQQIVKDAQGRSADYLLATADAKGRDGVARLAAGSAPGMILHEAESYKSGTADKTDTGYGEGIGVILSYRPDNVRATYAINVPEAADYDFELRYAALESRPVRVMVNDKLVLSDAAKKTTGGWNPEHQAWHAEGRITLVKGKNTLTIEAHNLLPHIDKLAVLPIERVSPAAGGRPSAGTIAEVARARKLFPEFIAGWNDYVRSADKTLFGPWRAAVGLSDEELAKSAAELFAPYVATAPAGLLDKPLPRSLRELAERYARLLTDNNGKLIVNGTSSPFALRTPLPANPELHYPKEFARISTASTDLIAIQKSAPEPVMVLSVADGAKYPQVPADGKPRNLFVQVRGNYLTSGEEAPPVFPRILAGERQQPYVAIGSDPVAAAKNQTRYGASRSASGRLEFANWIASTDNPLTARVWVNRVWQHHFGAGLVRSPDNFGKLGERPTHPELLDWLARRFMADGWSTKKLHKLILLSSTYRHSTARAPCLEDPENRLLSAMNRRRLEAEPIRDALLAVAGNLERRLGGTLLNNGNFTYVNNENSTNTARYDNHRRSVYLPVVRNTVFDFFQVFDFAEPHVSNGQRASTVVAPQALYMMNSPFVKDQAKVLAAAIMNEMPDDAERVRHCYLRVYGRPATHREVGQALDYVARYAKLSPAAAPDAWQSLCQVLFAGSEFIYVD